MIYIKSKRALTIFEATVSIIVLTVISLILFKKFISIIEFTRCREAFENVDVIRRSMDECYLLSMTYSKCSDLKLLPIPDPNNNGAAHFTYQILSTEPDEFKIIATRTALDEGKPTDTVIFTRTASGGMTRIGTGTFAGIH